MCNTLRLMRCYPLVTLPFQIKNVLINICNVCGFFFRISRVVMLVLKDAAATLMEPRDYTLKLGSSTESGDTLKGVADEIGTCPWYHWLPASPEIFQMIVSWAVFTS